MKTLEEMDGEQLFDEYLKISNRIQVYSNSKSYMFGRATKGASYNKDINYRKEIRTEMLKRMKK